MLHNQPKETTERIWRGLSERLRQFVRSRVDSAADVDDILQSTFLRIHSNIGDLREAKRLEAWVFQITRNAVTDHFRKKRVSTNDVESLEDSKPDSPTDVHAELSGCLNMMIEKLPEDQRRALLLYELGGKSQKEIAALESISLSGAKSRIQRGRKALEAMLRECCELQFDRRGNIVEYEKNNAVCCENEGCRY